MKVILILMVIAMALVLYVAYLNYKKTNCFCVLFKLQSEEIDKLRDMIKGQETDAIVQLRGSVVRLEKNLKEVKEMAKNLDVRIDILWETFEYTGNKLCDEIEKTKKENK